MARLGVQLLVLLLLGSPQVSGQQEADSLFNMAIDQPRYAEGKGPLILLDEAHHNFHTTTGRFRPFTEFLRRDGYIVKGNRQLFNPVSLRDVRILVIANALNEANVESWSLPTPSAFTDDEIRYVVEWVKQGGALFLIADHMPFPGAASKLANAFGFTFYNGFAVRRSEPDHSPGVALNVPDIFTPGHGLIEGPITRGSRPGEEVTSVRTFTGQAFGIPSGSTPLIVLDSNYELLLPETAWEFARNTTHQPADGLAQGASLQFGKGRIVVFGEAAMFSAQVQRGVRMGMNAPDAKQNPKFLLNIIHWLEATK